MTTGQIPQAKMHCWEQDLTLLEEINQFAHSGLKLPELLDGILHKLQARMPFTGAFIGLWNPEREQIVVQGSIGRAAVLDEVLPLDPSPTGYLLRERAPLLLNDMSASELKVDPAVRAYAGVPLLAGDKLVGTLELVSDQVGAFSPQALATLRLVATQAAVIIENARLYSETLRQTDEMATFNTLSAVLTASLNPNELLEIIVYSISQAIGCDRAAIFVMDSERGVLNLAKARGLSQAYMRSSRALKPTLGNRAQVVLDRYPLVVGDIRESKAFQHLASVAEAEGFVAFVDLPLRGRESVLGALTVYYNRPHYFDTSELELLTMFANQVTLALENARLYERTDRALARRVDQLAAIEEIGRELSSTLDLSRVFNLVLERAMGSTGASAGLLALCRPDSEKLELIAERGYPPEALKPYRDDGWSVNQGACPPLPSRAAPGALAEGPSPELAEGIIGRVIHTGETALVNDVQADPDYVLHVTRATAQLVVPIIKEGHVLGVVSLESSRAQGFSPDDKRFTTQLAELAAIAIDNARLFQRMRKGRDRLQAILDSSRDGILVVDPDTRIVLANPMIEQMSGLAAEKIVGRRAGEVLSELGPQAAALFEAPDNDTMRQIELMSDTVTKSTYEVPGPPPSYIEQVASPVIDKDGAVVGRLIAFRDVTEEHRLAQMRQDLVDMIIHDLRSPLTAVVGGLQVAGDLVDSQSGSEMVHHVLNMADQSCDQLMLLVDSLLDISRLEAGQMPLHPQPILLPQLAQSVIQQMRPLAARDMVTLQLRTDAPVLPVEADYELVSRVLVNLVDNALKYSPQDGVVTIEMIPYTLLTEPDAGTRCVRCTVLDVGPGIPKEYRETIFERFSQLGSRRRGTGLGLTFCRLAVQAHGGQIWVEDNPAGKGSAFSFTLPVVPSELLSTAVLD